jgi:hypothetical protein
VCIRVYRLKAPIYLVVSFPFVYAFPISRDSLSETSDYLSVHCGVWGLCALAKVWALACGVSVVARRPEWLRLCLGLRAWGVWPYAWLRGRISFYAFFTVRSLPSTISPSTPPPTSHVGPPQVQRSESTYIEYTTPNADATGRLSKSFYYV